MTDNKPEVARAPVEVFSTATNAWIIRTPGRAFPALVIQGDTLSSLLREAEELLTGLRATGGPYLALIEHAENLRDQLKERLEHYEAVLQEHGITLPYNRWT